MIGLDSPLPGLKHLLDTLIRVVHGIKTLCYAWPCNVALLCFRKMHGNIMLCERRVLSRLLKGFCCEVSCSSFFLLLAIVVADPRVKQGQREVPEVPML